MGRIREPELKALAERWTPIVVDLLNELGESTWKPVKERYSLLRKPLIVKRHLVEGPVQRGTKLAWAVSHTGRPSAFNERGVLGEGERRYWMVTLDTTGPLSFRVEGAGVVEGITPEAGALKEALQKARGEGPKVEVFYGNKGPLSHE
jgi:hypothetical protein